MDQPIDLFVTTLQSFLGPIVAFLPKLLAALLLFLLGWLFARLARAGVERLLHLMHFGQMAEKSGIEALAKAGGLKVSLAGVIGAVIYWLLLLAFAVSIANSLGLPGLSDLLKRVVLYLPNVLLAILILVLGTLLARRVNHMVFTWLHGIQAPGALSMSTGVEYAIQLFAFFLALVQLDIGTQLIITAFAIAFGGLVLALALAFGLGAREIVSEHIRDWAGK